jgi:glutathione S-transferase
VADVILHHYEMSPVSELVRVALGLKGLAWDSVLVPNIAPKPDLEPLTGGYRKTPVAQIGADIFCDSACILDALEALKPSPSFYPAPLGALARVVGNWCGGNMFRASAAVAIAPIAQMVPQPFWDDRKALFGMDKEPFLKAAPHLKLQWQAGMNWLAQTLSDGRAFVGGADASYADLAFYMDIWFGTRSGDAFATQFVANHPKLAAWIARMQAFGHGERTEISAAQALERARAAEPALAYEIAADCPFSTHTPVVVLTEDVGPTPVNGTLVHWSANSLALAREHPQVGHVVVHFPRIGIVVRQA